MQNDHNSGCNCYDCLDATAYTDHIESKSAGYYVGSVLLAKKPVTVYKLPDTTSTVVKQFNKGANVGVIYSYVLRDGILFWQLDWFSGKHMGYVKHDPALFDKKIIEDTASGLAHEKQMEASKKMVEDDPINAIGTGLTDLVKGAGQTISFAGKNLRWILLAVILLSITYLVITLKKAG